ncbi:MAG: hypothetical protein SGILL_000002 [Bacillariaceae sp.]
MTEKVKKEEEPTVVAAAAAVPESAAPAAGDKAAEPELTEEDLKAVEAITERLKFFFSNANIRQDQFIRKLLTESEDRAVPLEVMLRFNTIKKLSEKEAVLVKAAKELSDLLTVDEAKSSISRVVPFTPAMMKENIPLSLRVKNLPIKEQPNENDPTKTSKRYDVTVEEVRSLFDKFGDVALVKFQWGYDDAEGNRFNRNEKRRKQPNGCALVEFHKQEDCEKAAEATLTLKKGETVEAKEKITLPATDSRSSPIDLDVMLLADYVDAIRNRGKSKDRDHKRKRDGDKDADVKEAEPLKYIVDWKPGCVIQIKGFPENCDREAILDCLAEGLATTVEEVRNRRIYADYSRGQSDGAIRFPEPSDSVADFSKRLNDGELKILGAKVEGTKILEGDEEKKYWDAFIEFKTKQMNDGREKKRGRKWRSH